ncbi:MAG: transcriptional regulator AcuR [Fimbriimonadales bacterium]|nr:MAG: transcriptional regulator AcuR [Fimbriimonadales bacterium]
MPRKTDTKERILKEAMALIRDRGYCSVGVDDILKAANAGKSSFYHYFESKEALGAQVLEAYGRLANEGILREAFAPSVPPLERPLRFVELIRDQGEPLEGLFAGLYASDNGHVSDAIRSKAAEVVESVVQRFELAFQEAVQRMELYPDAPTRAMAEACVGFCEGALLIARLTGRSDTLERVGSLMAGIWNPYKV